MCKILNSILKANTAIIIYKVRGACFWIAFLSEVIIDTVLVPLSSLEFLTPVF